MLVQIRAGGLCTNCGRRASRNAVCPSYGKLLDFFAAIVHQGYQCLGPSRGPVALRGWPWRPVLEGVDPTPHRCGGTRYVSRRWRDVHPISGTRQTGAGRELACSVNSIGREEGRTSPTRCGGLVCACRRSDGSCSCASVCVSVPAVGTAAVRAVVGSIPLCLR